MGVVTKVQILKRLQQEGTYDISDDDIAELEKAEAEPPDDDPDAMEKLRQLSELSVGFGQDPGETQEE